MLLNFVDTFLSLVLLFDLLIHPLTNARCKIYEKTDLYKFLSNVFEAFQTKTPLGFCF